MNGQNHNPPPAAKPTTRGRPSTFDPKYIKKAYRLALLGVNDATVASILDVPEERVSKWKVQQPAFREALARGRAAADARVSAALYRRACGWSHEAVKIFYPSGATAPVYAPYIEHFPPDVEAAKFWLKNKQPELWKDRLELTGKDGGALALELLLNKLDEPKTIEHQPTDADVSRETSITSKDKE